MQPVIVGNVGAHARTDSLPFRTNPRNHSIQWFSGLPAGVSALFDPTIASSALTWLDISVDNNVAPGTYDLEICAIMLEDPAQPCTFAPLALVVTDPIPPGSISGRVYVTGLNLCGAPPSRKVTVVSGQELTVDFAGTYSGQ